MRPEPPPSDPVDDLLPEDEQLLIEPVDLDEANDDEELPADEPVDPSMAGS